jgi:two-component system alkaline phosphatase synthesis response regulator PhoP
MQQTTTSNISASLPQTTALATADDVYDDGYLRVEHQNYYVACDGQTLKLPRTEFLILSRLARQLDRIVSAEELWEYAWGKTKPLNADSLHVYLYRLRQKLTPHKLRIETMISVGYRLTMSQQ